jgi:hypothetical protein
MSGHKCLKNFGKMVQKIPGGHDMEFRGMSDWKPIAIELILYASVRDVNQCNSTNY